MSVWGFSGILQKTVKNPLNLSFLTVFRR